MDAGAQVVVWFVAVNRDSFVFANPHELDLAREPNPHLAFGAGPHRCPGASIARLALRVVLERFSSVTLAGEPVRRRSPFLNGFVNCRWDWSDQLFAV